MTRGAEPSGEFTVKTSLSLTAYFRNDKEDVSLIHLVNWPRKMWPTTLFSQGLWSKNGFYIFKWLNKNARIIFLTRICGVNFKL